MERTNRARETKWQRVVAISVMEINEIIGIATMERGKKNDRAHPSCENSRSLECCEMKRSDEDYCCLVSFLISLRGINDGACRLGED